MKKMKIAIISRNKKLAGGIKKEAEKHNLQVDVYENFEAYQQESYIHPKKTADVFLVDSELANCLISKGSDKPYTVEDAMAQQCISENKPIVLVYDNEETVSDTPPELQALSMVVNIVDLPPSPSENKYDKEFDFAFRCCEEYLSKEQGVATSWCQYDKNKNSSGIFPNRFLAEEFLYNNIKEEIRIQVEENGKEYGKTLLMSKDPKRIFYGEKISMMIVDENGKQIEINTWECPRIDKIDFLDNAQERIRRSIIEEEEKEVTIRVLPENRGAYKITLTIDPRYDKEEQVDAWIEENLKNPYEDWEWN